MAKSLIAKYERGESSPTTPQIDRLAQAMRVSDDAGLRLSRFFLGPAPDPAAIDALLSELPAESLKKASDRLRLADERVQATIRELESAAKRLRGER